MSWKREASDTEDAGSATFMGQCVRTSGPESKRGVARDSR